MAFVLDNSVLVAWFFPSQATPYTYAIAKRLETEKAWVPALWQLEISNVLRTACLRHRLAHAKARASLLDSCSSWQCDSSSAVTTLPT